MSPPILKKNINSSGSNCNQTANKTLILFIILAVLAVLIDETKSQEKQYWQNQ